MSVSTDNTDLLGVELTRSPYDYLDELRREDPIHWNARHRAWLVTAYDDVFDGFRDLRLKSNRLKRYREQRLNDEQLSTIGRSIRLLESWMVFQDNPEHHRLRGIVHKAFTRQSVASLEDEIRELVRQQIAVIFSRLSAEPDRPVDLLNEVAYEIPGPIICKMLGVATADRTRFVEWSEQISGLIGGFVDDTDRYENAHSAVVALEAYLTGIIETTKGGDDNLMGRLVRAEADGQTLTRDEVISTGILMLFGGNRTTSCMITNGLRALMLHPDQQQAIRNDRTLLGTAVDEVMRWESHTKFTVRVVGEDLEWKGRRLQEGERVFLSPLAANHDPAHFSNPRRFDVRRQNANRHIGFGTGVHHCLGQALARLELKVVFEEMIDVLPRLEMVDPESEWLPTLINRVQKRMLVRLASS